MSTLIQLLDRPIAYNPAFAKLRVGKVRAGPVAAVFLSQMVYWHNRMDGGWMYKTQADIASETALTRDEQETARKRLVAIGVLEEDLRGVPATMHYRVNAERLESLLIELTRPAKKARQDITRLRGFQNVETPQTGLVQSLKQECGNPANKSAAIPQTSLQDPTEPACGDPANFHTGDYTENTQEITQENKPSRPVATQPDENLSPNDFHERHPDAVVYSPANRQWGTAEDLRCAEWIHRQIVKLYEQAAESDGEVTLPREPTWAAWANDIRLMRQRDGRSHRQICEMFGRANRDTFWRRNVLSPAKLREKWDELALKLATLRPGGQGDSAFRSSYGGVDYSAIPEGFRG